MNCSTAPDRTEAAEYYFTYINQVAPGDIRKTLAGQTAPALAFLGGISDERSLHRDRPDQWSARQVVSHINDCERLFVYRAMWFARGFDAPLPSFDQNIAANEARADERSWQSHLDEFRAIRAATVAFFDSLRDEAWMRRGIASDNPVTVRALAFICAGHAAHHFNILQKRFPA